MPGDTLETREQLDWLWPKLVRRYGYGGTAGSRNEYEMSGRVE